MAGATLTLVNREPSQGAPDLIVSTFRLTKGGTSLLVHFSRNAGGKVSGFDVRPDQPYE